MGRKIERRTLDLMFDSEIKSTNEGIVFVRILNRGMTVVMSKIHFTDDHVGTNNVCLYGAVLALHVLLTYCKDFISPRGIRISTSDRKFLNFLQSSQNNNEVVAKLKSEIQSLLSEITLRGVTDISFGTRPKIGTPSDRSAVAKV